MDTTSSRLASYSRTIFIDTLKSRLAVLLLFFFHYLLLINVLIQVYSIDSFCYNTGTCLEHIHISIHTVCELAIIRFPIQVTPTNNFFNKIHDQVTSLTKINNSMMSLYCVYLYCKKMATSPVGYKCKFLDSVPEDYFCKQCKHVSREPVLTECCNATMCKACAQGTQQDKKPCSNCQKILDNYISYYKLQDKINVLTVCCSKKEPGCTWTGELQQFDAHSQNDCEYVDIECEKCKENVQKHNMHEHQTKLCPEREYSCQYCNFKDTYKIVTEQHFEVCTLYILKCPNECGVTFERGDLEDHMKMCRLETVKCEFSFAGCDEEFIRDKQQEHMELNAQKHLTLMAEATKTIRQQQETQEQRFLLQVNAQIQNKKLESVRRAVKGLTKLLRSTRNEYLFIISTTVLIIALFYQGATTEKCTCISSETTSENQTLDRIIRNLEEELQAQKNTIDLEIKKLKKENCDQDHEIISQNQELNTRLKALKGQIDENTKLSNQNKKLLSKKPPSKEPPSKESPSKESPSKESSSKESPSKESPSKEPPSKESPSKESPSKESSSKESPSKKPPSKESPSKESPSKESPSKESPSKKSSSKEQPDKKIGWIGRIKRWIW